MFISQALTLVTEKTGIAIPDGLFSSIDTGNGETLIYLILFMIIFLECGVPPMVWLPGDSLLFLTGLLAATGYLNIILLLPVYAMAGILGYICNYYLGNRIGLPLILKIYPAEIIEKNLFRTEEFYKKWGLFAIPIARFIPVIRTFSPFLAGIGNMDKKKFFALATFSGLIWGPGICLLGFFSGIHPWLVKYQSSLILITFVGMILTMIVPIWISLFRRKN